MNVRLSMTLNAADLPIHRFFFLFCGAYQCIYITVFLTLWNNFYLCCLIIKEKYFELVMVPFIKDLKAGLQT